MLSLVWQYQQNSMRLTLAVLFAWFAIYCNYSVVLSLPPSLIANTAALRQQQQELQQQQQQHTASLPSLLWKKDARVLFDASRSSNSNSNSNSDVLPDIQIGKPATTMANLDTHQQQQQLEQQRQQQFLPQTNFNRKMLSDYDLDTILAAADENLNGPLNVARQTKITSSASSSLPTTSSTLSSSTPQETATRLGALDTFKYYTPFKYWARHCQLTKNCSQDYYRAMLAARKKAQRLQRLQRLAAAATEIDSVNFEDPKVAATTFNSNEDNIGGGGEGGGASVDDFYDEDINNEVFLLLNGEQDLIKFLYWAMEQLYPFTKLANVSEHSAEYYHPGMFIWKKLNLSGLLEPPLVVEEPRYVLVRREKLQDEFKLGSADDPFIPPRGRKHNSPDLDALLQRYETFVPNRGKRDKIKDIFKYDDLFYPNRGKKQRDIFKIDDPFYPNRGKKLRDIYNIDDPFFPNRGKRHGILLPVRSMLSNEQQQQQQDVADMLANGDAGNDNNDDNNDDYDDNMADEYNVEPHLTWLQAERIAPLTPPQLQQSPTRLSMLQRIFGKLKRKLQLEQWQQRQHVANEINSSNSKNKNNINDDNDDEDHEDNENVAQEKSSDWLQRMSTHKINGYDQSVKPSMSTAAAMLSFATEADEPAAEAASADTATIATTTTTELRKRRLVNSFASAAAAKLAAVAAANRLHSTRSMSTNSQLQQQKQHKQLQRPTIAINLDRLHHRQQAQQLPQPQLESFASPLQTNLRFFANPASRHQVKSYNDFEPLFWQQLQFQQQQQQQQQHHQQQSKLRQQKPSTGAVMQHTLRQRSINVQQQQQPQPQQLPPETQLSHVDSVAANPIAAAAAVVVAPDNDNKNNEDNDSIDIDTDYANFNI